MKMKVAIRQSNPHNGGEVKPEAASLDGYVGEFRELWTMVEDEPYPGEIACQPLGKDWPLDAPVWIASGDLEPVE